MSRTLSPAPPTDRRFWRRLLARVHPDAGGSHDLFLWVSALFEHVAGDAIEEPQRSYEPPRRTATQDSPRVPYEAAFEVAASFEGLTRYAVAMSDHVEEPYATLLAMLEDCREVARIAGLTYRQQFTGATYKSLAAIGYRVGMSKAERVRWYRIAEEVPLSQRHAGHILSRLHEKAA